MIVILVLGKSEYYCHHASINGFSFIYSILQGAGGCVPSLMIIECFHIVPKILVNVSFHPHAGTSSLCSTQRKDQSQQRGDCLSRPWKITGPVQQLMAILALGQVDCAPTAEGRITHLSSFFQSVLRCEETGTAFGHKRLQDDIPSR